MRQTITSVLELLGIAAIVVGVALISSAAAFIVAGAGTLAYAWKLSK